MMDTKVLIFAFKEPLVINSGVTSLKPEIPFFYCPYTEMKKLVLIVTVIATSLVARAQTIPVNPKFGAISDAEIDLKVYEPDTSAIALMLYRDYSLDLRINNNGRIVKDITVHERVKVLKEEGKKYGDYSFIYLSNTSIKEYVTDVKVETVNREGGKIVRTKMSKQYDFDEKYSDDARRRSFSAENVKVGSVIEVFYKFSSPRYYDIDDIAIQLSIPVNQTHIEVGTAEFFRTNRTMRGSIATTNGTDRRMMNIGGGSGSYRVDVDIYDAVDVPALPSESHTFCPSQYGGAIIYDMSGVVIPGSVYENFSMTWPDVDKAITESDIIAVCKSKYKDVDELEAAVAGAEGDEARIVAVRNYVTGKVKWDENSHLVPKGAKEILKQGSGSDADINALTASALNTIGYIAEPVMIKERTNGILLDYHISLRSFDTFILRVSTQDRSQSWFLDAAREEGYLNILDPRFLIEKARIIPFTGPGEWVDLRNLSKSRLTVFANAKVTEDGTLACTVNYLGANEDSYDIKYNYNDYDTEDAFLEKIESGDGIEITHFEIKDEYGPKAEFSYDFIRDLDLGDRLYIKPVVHAFHSDTAFRREKRILPVDFAYPENLYYTFVLEVPQGYVVEELPKNASYACPPVNGRIQFQAKQTEDRVTVVYRFIIDDMRALPEEYSDFRFFWEAAVGIEKSTIVLKKQ